MFIIAEASKKKSWFERMRSRLRGIKSLSSAPAQTFNFAFRPLKRAPFKHEYRYNRVDIRKVKLNILYLFIVFNKK